MYMGVIPCLLLQLTKFNGAPHVYGGDPSEISRYIMAV